MKYEKVLIIADSGIKNTFKRKKNTKLRLPTSTLSFLVIKQDRQITIIRRIKTFNLINNLKVQQLNRNMTLNSALI